MGAFARLWSCLLCALKLLVGVSFSFFSLCSEDIGWLLALGFISSFIEELIKFFRITRREKVDMMQVWVKLPRLRIDFWLSEVFR